MENKKTKLGLNSLALKIIACVLMTLDHIALLFLSRGELDINTDYYILRAIGKIAFPIFAFLAVEGTYKTKNILNYLLRVGVLAIILDICGYLLGYFNGIKISENPLIGNAFTDMFMGILAVYFLKKKNWYSLFALFPVAFEFLSHLTINENYGTLFKSDWGSFSIVLFICYFIARELSTKLIKDKAVKDNIDESIYIDLYQLTYNNISQCIALIFVELTYYLLWRYNYSLPILPNDFVPLGTYSTLACVFLIFYNGKKGYSSKKIQYFFYAYYPFHIILLGILSMFFGVLK